MTRDEALTLTHGATVYHVTLRNRDGSAVWARVNGACKTWKRRPDDYRVPMKHGLRDCFYLTPANAHEWSLTDPTEEQRLKEFRARRKAGLRARFGMAKDTPDNVLRDRCVDDGMGEPILDVIFTE